MAHEAEWGQHDLDRLWATRLADPVLLERTLPALPATPQTALLGAFLKLRVGEFTEALDTLADLLRRDDLDATWRARVVNLRSCALYAMGLSREAMMLNTQERRLAEEASDLAGITRARHEAVTFHSAGAPRASVQYFLDVADDAEQAWPSCGENQRLEMRVTASVALYNVVRQQRLTKQTLHDPLPLLKRCETIASHVWPTLAASARAARLELALESGNIAEARRLAENLPSPYKVDDVIFRPLIVGAIARLQSASGRTESAVSLLLDHLNNAPRLFQEDVLAALVDVYEQAGDFRMALQTSRKHVDLLRELEEVRSQNVVAALEVWYRTEEAHKAARMATNQASTLEQTVRELQASHERVKESILCDTLTGLRNRAFLQEWGPSLLRNNERGGGTSQLAVIDLDNFKNVNDTYGHRHGDTVLCRFAQLLRSATDPEDVLVRLGGDEFVVIRRGDSSHHLAMALQALTRGGHLAQEVAELGVAVSVGVTATGSSDLEEAMHAADMLMYKAKTLGGDRVQCETGVATLRPREVPVS